MNKRVLSIGLALILSLFVGIGSVWADDTGTDSDRGPSHDRGGSMRARMDGYGGGHGYNPGHGGGHHRGVDCERLFNRIKHLRHVIRNWHGHRGGRYAILVGELREAKIQYRMFCGRHDNYRDGIAD